MVIVQVRHIKRRTGGDTELTEIAGAAQITAVRQGSAPAGSFRLNHISTLVLSPVVSTTAAMRVGVVGSIRDPQTTYRNTVALKQYIIGSSGTRAANAGIHGSTPASGALSAYFIAHGW